ncbi:MAG: histidinol-phosphate aminotransferase family protein [Patescibacteria group bacterium]|nr:histidinol-phosphate aminotransferase family protein [Patescibacteria group bacterium]MDE1966412.1 histidinol-phosphate aminotransferase family protein [Patescibacteria group bacterium]
MIPLDKNESYWLLDDELVEAARGFGRMELGTYPDYTALKAALAAYADVPEDCILVTPGSDAAIEAIARAYVGKGEAVLPVPTFYGYERILDRVGSEIVPVPYESEAGEPEFPLRRTLAAITAGKPKAVFLCNPNNPLGCGIKDADAARVLETASLNDVITVSDEAYFEYSGRTLLPSLTLKPNLIILRTLSKAFGIPGARVGYAIAAPEAVERMQRELLPWPVAHESAAAALALLGRAEKVKERRDAVIRMRASFFEALQALPNVQTLPTETNFAFIHVPHAREAAEKLGGLGVRVALGEDMSRFPEAKSLLVDTLRIAIPSPEDMGGVVDNFAKVFTNIS